MEEETLSLVQQVVNALGLGSGPVVYDIMAFLVFFTVVLSILNIFYILLIQFLKRKE